MGQISQNGEAVAHYFVAFTVLYIGDKAYTAGVVLVSGIVKPVTVMSVSTVQLTEPLVLST